MPAKVFAAESIVILGDSVWRTDATTATIKLLSDTAGTAYYKITDNANVPTETEIKADNKSTSVTADNTTSISLEGLTSGAKYVYVVVNDGTNDSNILTYEMPYDVYYNEGFEAYNVNTTVASGTTLTPITYKSGSSEVLTDDDSSNKVLQVYNNAFWSENYISIDSSSLSTNGTYVLESDICAVSEITGTGNVINLAFQKDDNGSQAGVFFYLKSVERYKAIKDTTGNKVLVNDYSWKKWYHIAVVCNVTNSKYDIYIDGEKKASDLTLPTGINRIILKSCAAMKTNFDNINFYVGAPKFLPPTLSGNSVYRSSAEKADVWFLSDKAGTAYYTVADSATKPEADTIVSSGKSAGAVTANTTAKLTLSETDLTTGEQYVHIVVKDSDGLISDVLTIDMPYDVYFNEDFEAYPAGMTSGESTFNFNSSNNKIVTDEDGNKVLQLTNRVFNEENDFNIATKDGAGGIVSLKLKMKSNVVVPWFVFSIGDRASFSHAYNDSTNRWHAGAVRYDSTNGDYKSFTNAPTFNKDTYYTFEIRYNSVLNVFDVYIDENKVNDETISLNGNPNSNYKIGICNYDLSQINTFDNITLSVMPIEVEIHKADTLTYTGSEQTGLTYDTTYITKSSGDVSGTNAGDNYSATFSL